MAKDFTKAAFLGRGWDFPPTFNKRTRKVAMTTGETDIQRSLQVLLDTRLGERAMLPDYGANLDELLFAPIDTSLLTYVREGVKTAIILYEPRIKLEDVVLTTDNELNGKVNVEIEYTIRSTNTRHNYVYPYYLDEGTDTE